MQFTHRPAAVYAANLGRATGLFITPNQFAAWLVPFSALAAGVTLSARDGRARAFAAAAAVTGAVALFATFSLGGWLGGATALVVATWWLERRVLAGGIAALLVVVGLGAAFFPGLTHHRLSERFVRLDATRTGLRVVAAFPLFGVGPLAYPVVYPTFRIPDTTEDAVISEHPHNVVISLLADTGIAGALAIAFGWWRLARAIGRGYRRADPRSRRLVACICAGLIGRFVHGAVDLVAVLELAFVWIPFGGLALAVASSGDRA
jgi:O-antigen ligase